ncbi:polyamine ABC transporter substrate-binding protein [Marinobacterium arenosum]|uniref:polyamine ABC transporter substrate-binding protein n=1 Tax=Marinobacterium arenosum TaxID=2862496 RepID=UPI001C95D713|nr:polyamine ABC transporter substrate-binding protein [Marinobacterium arenosum]MBY4678185.1 polyamine ABC transporter substrate-binding protein [Marinobacterium arenosum]
MNPTLKSLLLAGATLGLAANATAGDKDTVHIYNWADYYAEDTLSNFEQRSGLKVQYDVFDSHQVLETKLLTGGSGFDLVYPEGSNMLKRQIAAGAYQKLDKSQLTNWGNIDPTVLKWLADNDPANEYAVPYTWGTVGIGYNIAKLQERLPQAPTDSWQLLLDPNTVAKFTNCGVTMLDDPIAAYMAVQAYLGRDPASTSKDDLKAVEEHLQKIRPHITYFHSSQYRPALAAGDVCLSQSYSGDLYLAQARADETGNGIKLAYSIPREGAEVFMDVMAIPVDAPNADKAHLFMNYLLEGKVIADVTNYTYFANGNSAAEPFIDDGIKQDAGIYPPETVKAKLFTKPTYPQKFVRKLNRMWAKVKSGR